VRERSEAFLSARRGSATHFESDIRFLVDVPVVTDARVSPDGKLTAYTVVEVDHATNSRIGQVWVVPSHAGEPTQWSSGPRSHQLPRWSPDGTQLAVVSTRLGLASQVCVGSAKGGDLRVLADWPDEEIEELEWAPNGRALAFTSRIRDGSSYLDSARSTLRVTRAQTTLDGYGLIAGRPRHLFIIEADGHSGTHPPRQLTFGEFSDSGVYWSPDGQRIAFTSARQTDWDLHRSSDIFVVDVDRGTLTQLTRSGRLIGDVAWNRDGTKLAFAVNPGPEDPYRHTDVAIMDSAGSAEQVLTRDLDRNVLSVGSARTLHWTGSLILFLVEIGGADHVYAVDARGGSAPAPLVEGLRQIRGFDSAAETLAIVYTDATHPPGLALIVDGRERQVSKFDNRFRPQNSIRFEADNGDGGKVEAWVLPPARRSAKSSGRYPTVLHIHGGPNFKDGYRYSAEKQAFALAGYAVLTCNPRGSTGYSERWARAIRGSMAAIDPGGGLGEPAFADLMAVIDEAVTRFDFVDPDRLGVTGTSYGGFMSVWALGSSQRFRAAVCINPSINLATLLWRGDWIIPWLSGMLGVDVLSHTDEVLRNSPISRAKSITAPLLLIHGEEDQACTIEQSIQLFVLLRFLGRNVELVRLAGASHLIASPSQVHERLRLTLDWWARYLAHPAHEPVSS